MTRISRYLTAASALWVAACGTVTAPPPVAAEPRPAPQVASADTSAAKPAPPATTPSAPAKSTPGTAAPDKTAAAKPAPEKTAAAKAVPEKTASPASPVPEKAAPTKTAPPPKSPLPTSGAKPQPQAAANVAAAAPATPAAAPAPPPLDLRTLEQRLKDTNAIGVLTKLSLKNQVDDLVSKFRAYHAGARPPTLPELRPAFELLLMKVLSLLQDKDAALATDINKSRDAIWRVLTDKQKLEQLT